MKPIWVVLIAILCLGLGLFAGMALFAGPGMVGGLVAGSSYGACSIVLDLVDQKVMPQDKAEEFYGRFAGRLEALLKSSGVSSFRAPQLAQCEADIEKFRAEAEKAAKK